MWKIPGGHVEAGEFIGDAAVREVWEETGIKTKFVSILGIGELKTAIFGQPGFQFFCLF